MNKIVVAVCIQCYRKLLNVQGLGRLNLKTYVEICADYSLTSIIMLDPKKLGAADFFIQNLERSGYIVTTEASKDMIFLRPIGHEIEEHSEDEVLLHKFCAFRKEHLN